MKNRYASVEELNKEVIIELFKGKKDGNILSEKQSSMEPKKSTENVRIKKSNKFQLKEYYSMVSLITIILQLFIF
jgi:hypothetical protein